MSQISYGTITITDITDIDTIKNWYLATSASSGVTKSTSGWTDTIQQMTNSKQYLWSYEQILGANNIEISSTDPVIIGHYGQDGQDGQSGVDGNSIVSIDEYYQATNSTTNPGASGWQKNTIVIPTNTNKYLWNYQVINYSKTAAEGTYADARIIGVYGDTGPQGPQGNPGTAGINTATVYLYQRATSAPSKPSGNLTYTFTSAEITSGTLGNWKQSIGELSGTDPIWVIAAVASSNGTTDVIASTEWSTQIKLAQNGTDGTNGTNGTNGLNQATVYIYKRATSATAPSATTYTFSDGSFTVPSDWSKTIPASDGNPCYVSSAVAIGNGTTATLTWNTPSVLVEDGTDGISPTVVQTSNGVQITDAEGNVTNITNGAAGQSYYTYIRYADDSSGSNMSSSPTGKTYIGVYSGTASSAPTTASSYTWSKYVGDPGTPATQYYAFVKYATDANGTGMQDNPDSTHIYVGTYTGTNASPAASAYKWSKYVGQDGQSATQYYAFIKYATSSIGADMTDTPTANTKYVGTYSGTNASPTASDYKWSFYIGTDGVSVTETRELYYLRTDTSTVPTITATSQITATDRQNGWTSIVPTYISTAEYWTCIETSLSTGGPVWSIPVKNVALTDESYRALEALSISQNSNENAQGAMSIARAQGQHFWFNAADIGSGVNLIESGAYITDTAIDTFKSGRDGGYLLARSDKVEMGKASAKYAVLDATSLKFYTPGTTYKSIEVGTGGITIYRGWDATEQENLKGIEITSSGLEIFGSSQSTADVTVTSNGINIGKGSIIGADNTVTNYVPDTGFLYLSTKNYGSYLNIADSGNRTNWRLVVGNHFGVTKDGNVYMNAATISGKIVAITGQFGGTSVGDSWGWTLGLGRLYSGTMGSDNSLHMRTFNLGTNDEAVSINNCAPRKDWRFTVGSKFGVTSTGELFADGANLTNINAGSINIGPVVKYYVCDTEAATSVKTINNVSNFSLVTGLTINVTFTYGNTSSAPTLNINDTGAVSIMAYDGTTLSNSYEYNIAAGSSRTFTYNGTNWLLQDNGAGDAYLRAYNAEDTAYDYITKIDNAGIFISPYNQSPSTSSPGNSIKIDGSGMKIYKGGIAIAQYGESAIIGKESAAHSVIDANGQRFYGSNGTTQLANIGYGSGTSQNGTAIAPYYTFGIRVGNIGNWSVAEGYSADANGFASHAEGGDCTASGSYSHAENGETSATGPSSHSEGIYTLARGSGSHAGGYGTIADGLAQTVIGSYNAIDPNYNANKPENKAKYVFVIGNGTSNTTTARSNALTVDWNGNIQAGGLDCGVVSITPTAGSVTSKKVTFNHTFSNPPYVVATAQSAVPGAISEVSVSNVTTTEFTMYILRSNNTSTNINWIAMYCG